MRPVTTLFMLMSLDGKISTGATDQMDVDRDFPLIPGVREGLGQYYEIEQTTELWSLNTGRVQAKLGVNERPLPEKRLPVSFVILDNTHLTRRGVEYLCARTRQLALVTSTKTHPAFSAAADNLHVLYYEELELDRMLCDLRARFGCEALTVQSGGTLNARLVREGLIDYVDVVVAPVIVGGRDTATLADGPSLTKRSELGLLRPLELLSCERLQNSYLRLRYRVAGKGENHAAIQD